MDIKLKFLGAARNVTGSCYLLTAGGRRIIVDCGMYQERDLRARNWESLPVPPGEIDAVVLTHAHLDHCGRLPKLVKEGFRGAIHSTGATADIAAIVMQDAARLQAEDVEFKKARHAREGRTGPHPYEPLYTVEDAVAAQSMFKPCRYEQPVDVAPGIEATFFEAGHILGSASVRLSVGRNGERRTVLFSGDLGRWDTPILRDPKPCAGADYVVVESTYGNRKHKDTATIPASLADVINDTRRRGGNVVIPSFAIERAQELLYHLNTMLRENAIPHLLVFLDSPMAVQVTEVFRRHPELFDEEARRLLAEGRHPCDFAGLQLSRSVAQSKAINHISGTSIIIAGSGMCTGGRVKHHLKANISRPESTVLFVGYQANGTLGRIILEHAPRVRIHGEEYDVRARVTRINGFSAHGDRDELMRWLDGMEKAPRGVIVTHGEPEAAQAFAGHVRERKPWAVSVPDYLEEIALG